MERLIDTVVDAVLGLRGTVAYGVIGGLAFGETAAFIGLMVPGEIAMILGGVLASQGRVELGLLALIAGGAASLGDSFGYLVGRRWGRALTRWEPIEQRFAQRIEDAEAYFQRRGGRAVAVGRWASVVRTFVPFVAGSAGMPVGRFLAYSIPSASAWAVVHVLGGFLAGQSWDLVERYSGRASLILLLVIALGLLIRWSARRVAANQDRVRALVRRVASWGAVRWVRQRYGAQLRWLARRFNPNVARGLGLTLGFVVLVLGTVLGGVLLNDVTTFEGVARFDEPVQRWFVDVRTEGAVRVADAIVVAFHMPWVLVPAVLVAAYAGWRATPRAAVRATAGVVGAVAIALLTREIVTPRLLQVEFPSVATTASAAVVTHAVAVAGTRLEWGNAVRTAAAGAFAVVVIGTAAMVTFEATLSSALFGAVLGVTWAAALEVQGRLPVVGGPGPTGSPQGGRGVPTMPSPPR